MKFDVSDDYNIVASTITFTEDYPEPNGSRLLAYWRSLKGERDRPTWSEFDFVDLMDITHVLIVKDVINGGEEFRNRYWGASHVDLDRFDGTGKFFADIYKPEDLPDILKLYRQPLIKAAPMVMRGTLHYQDAGNWREYSSICCGFTDDAGTVTHLVSAYDMKELKRQSRLLQPLL